MKKAQSPGSVRIIAGTWRHRRLPVADIECLRPTTDRIRETLFSWLQHAISGARCLDLFAGSGALGFEAASRGASEVLMIEQDRHAVAGLLQARELLKADRITITQMDALAWLDKTHQAFDIIFLDPPFDGDLLSVCFEKLKDSALVKTGTLIYAEQARTSDELACPSWLETTRQANTGQVRYSLLKVS